MIDKKYIENFITSNFNQLDYTFDLNKLTNKINNILKKDIIPSKINDDEGKKKVLQWSNIFRDKDIEIEVVNVFKVKAKIECLRFVYGTDYSPEINVEIKEISFINGLSKKTKNEFADIKNSLEFSSVYLQDIVFKSKDVDDFYNNVVRANKEIAKFCNDNKINKNDIYNQICMILYKKGIDNNGDY